MSRWAIARPDALLRELDPSALAAFLAVLDAGSFTAAATQLGISQPAVSLAVKRLEERLGAPLLVRTRRQVTPSRAGELLARGARAALEALGTSLAQIADERARPSGRVRLGCHESLAAYALPAFMARFLRAYPDVELRLWNGRSQEVTHELLEGRVELALIVNPRPHPDLVIAPMFEDAVELCHGLTARRAASPTQTIASLPLIYVPELAQTRDILDHLHARRIRAAQALPCSSLELVKSLVLDEVGVGILPRRVATYGTRKRLYSLSPPMPRYTDRIALVRRYDLAMTAALRVVITELSAHCKAMA